MHDSKLEKEETPLNNVADLDKDVSLKDTMELHEASRNLFESTESKLQDIWGKEAEHHLVPDLLKRLEEENTDVKGIDYCTCEVRYANSTHGELIVYVPTDNIEEVFDLQKKYTETLSLEREGIVHEFFIVFLIK